MELDVAKKVPLNRYTHSVRACCHKSAANSVTAAFPRVSRVCCVDWRRVER